MNIETYSDAMSGSRALSARGAWGEVWAQWLAGNDTSDWPHPLGRRWGINREAGGTTLYAARLVVTVSRAAR